MLLAAFAEATSDLEEIERFARMTSEERLMLFAQLCDLTDSVQSGRPNRDALKAPQPIGAEAAALWAKLMHSKHG